MKMCSDKKMRFKTAHFALQGGLCTYCGRAMTLETSTIDHIKPLAKGGTWAKANLTIAHLGCNQLKGCLFIPQYVLDDKELLHNLFRTRKIGKHVNEYYHQRGPKSKVR